MSQFEPQADDDEVICPYCKARWQCEADDYSEEADEDECPECERKFYRTTEFSVTHRTRPDCALNKQDHQFVQRLSKPGFEWEQCHICGYAKPKRDYAD